MDKQMPNVEIEKADNLMRASGYPIRMSGGISESIINDMEKRLKCKFPLSYRDFLKRYGRLAFLSTEFYGFTKDGFDAEKSPSAIWVTETNRKRGDLADDMICVMATGFGPYFALATSKIDASGECPVVLVAKEVPADYHNLGNFGAFFLSEITEALKIKAETESQ